MIDKETLRKMYYDQRLSVAEIARRLGVSSSGIDYHFRRFGFTGRDPWDYPPRDPRHLQLDSSVMSILEGELLGDGCLRQRSSQAAFFVYHTGCKDHIEYLIRAFQYGGIEFGPMFERMSSRGYRTWLVESKSYAELAILRQRWYPLGKKIVPDTLHLTPTVALHWYLGDGCLNHVEKRHLVVLSTNGFSDQDRERLLDQLRSIQVAAVTDKQGRIIFANKKSLENWFTYLPPCPIPFYRYKWP